MRTNFLLVAVSLVSASGHVRTRTAAVAQCSGTPNVEGCWGPLVPMIVNEVEPGDPALTPQQQSGRLQAVHLLALHDERVLALDFLHFLDAPSAVVVDPFVADPFADGIRNAGVPPRPGEDPDYHDLFCSGHTATGQGWIFFRGGPLGNINRRRMSIYVPAAPGSLAPGAWQAAPDEVWTIAGTNRPTSRFYPTTTLLANGNDVLVLDGWDGCASVSPAVHGNGNVPVLFHVSSSPPFGTWDPIYSAEPHPAVEVGFCENTGSLCTPAGPDLDFALGYYPMAFQAADGTVFIAGASDLIDCSDPDAAATRKLDTVQATWDPVPATTPPGTVVGRSAVMYGTDLIMKTGRAGDGLFEYGAQAARIDLAAPTPEWINLPDMLNDRLSHFLIALPDGNILAIGGTPLVNGVVAGPDLYKPTTNSWTHMADPPDPPGPTTPQPRGYHSSAVLLPDGSVFTGGGEDCVSGCDDQNTYQIYQPPYFFDANGEPAVRPAISCAGSDATIYYGTPFIIKLASGTTAQSITKVRLIRPGAATHSFDHSARMMELTEFSVVDNQTLQVTAPLNGNYAPPGYYMLFVAQNANGALPSKAHWVRLIEGGANAITIVSADPPADNPYLTGQQPFRDVLDTGTGTTVTRGIGATGTPSEGGVGYAPVSVTFSDHVRLEACGVSVACTYASTTTNPQPCPSVTAVTPPPLGGPGPYWLTLSGAIPPGACTTFTFAAAPGQELTYESLPGDANMSGLTNTQDLLELTSALNNSAALDPGNLPRYDMNRSGLANTQDLLRLVQLLNGTLTTEPWNQHNVDCSAESGGGGGESAPMAAGGAQAAAMSSPAEADDQPVDLCALIEAACAEWGWTDADCQPLLEFVAGQ